MKLRFTKEVNGMWQARIRRRVKVLMGLDIYGKRHRDGRRLKSRVRLEEGGGGEGGGRRRKRREGEKTVEKEKKR